MALLQIFTFGESCLLLMYDGQSTLSTGFHKCIHIRF